MSAVTTSVAVKKKGLGPGAKRIIWIAIVIVVVAAMAFSTKIVPADSSAARTQGAFNAAEYGKKQFPKQQAFISKNAVSAADLATALTANAGAAAKKYGKSADGATYVIPVTFTGVVGTIPAAGYTPVTGVEGLPASTKIGLQLGPAINGTDLRDVSGNITLNDFENQIQFQNAAAAINNQLKAQLKKIGASSLEGKTIQVHGAFTLVNPAQWNVTPSSITIGSQ